MDSSATSHMTSDDGNIPSSTSVTIGNGSTIPIYRAGHTVLPTPSFTFHVNDYLVVPSIFKISSLFVSSLVMIALLILTSWASLLRTFEPRVILRSNSVRDLYTLLPGATATPFFDFLSATTPESI